MNLFKKIFAAGLHTTNDLNLRLQIKFINVAAVIGSLFNVFLLIINIIEKLYWQLAINLVLIFLIFIPALVFNRRGNIVISKAIIFYPVTLLIFLASILNSGENREFNLIGFAIVGLFIYNKKYGVLAFLYCSFLFFAVYFISIFKEPVIFRDLAISFISFSGIFLAEFFVITFYKNNLLEASIMIQAHNKALQRGNDTIERNTVIMVKSNNWLIRLLSILSHDLKSPINSIKGALQLYANKNMSQQEWQEILPALNHKVSKTEDLIDKLLIWTRIQLNGVRIIKSWINWENEVKFLIDELSTSLQQKNLAVKVHSEATKQIYTDKSILYILLRNLLTNAVKFSYADGVVDLYCKQIQGDTIFMVKDYGKGMSEKVMKSLFSNHQIKGTGTNNEPGNGIGLIICKELAEKLGATIEVDSQEGKGTTFTLKILGTNDVTSSSEHLLGQSYSY